MTGLWPNVHVDRVRFACVACKTGSCKPSCIVLVLTVMKPLYKFQNILYSKSWEDVYFCVSSGGEKHRFEQGSSWAECS